MDVQTDRIEGLYQFWKLLWEGAPESHWATVTFFDERPGVPPTQRFKGNICARITADDLRELAKLTIEKADANKWAAFQRVTTTIKQPTKYVRGVETDAAGIRSYFCDKDDHDGCGSGLDKFVTDVCRSNLTPSMIVLSSPQGRHTYHRSNQFHLIESLKDLQFHKSILKGLQVRQDTDPAVAELARISRCPHTTHLKDPDNAMLTTIICADSAIQYDSSALPSIETEIDYSETYTFQPETLAPQWMTEFEESHQKLYGRLYSEETAKAAGAAMSEDHPGRVARHRNDLHCALYLMGQCDWTPGQVLAAMQDPSTFISSKTLERNDIKYAEQTIRSALETLHKKNPPLIPLTDPRIQALIAACDFDKATSVGPLLTVSNIALVARLSEVDFANFESTVRYSLRRFQGWAKTWTKKVEAARAPNWQAQQTKEKHIPRPEKLRNFTDMGNAERVIDRYGDVFKYNVDQQKFLAWNGDYWKVDTGDNTLIDQAVAETIRAISTEEVQDFPDFAKELAAHGLQSEADHRIKAAISRVAKRAEVSIEDKQLNTHKNLIPLAGGKTLDLQYPVNGRITEVRLRDSMKEDLLTHFCNLRYDPTARSEEWEQSLAFHQPNPAVRDFFQMAMGYGLIGGTKHHLLMHLGDTKTGKSTHTIVPMKILGRDYAIEVPKETILWSRNGSTAGGPRPDLTMLIGKRLGVTAELRQRALISEDFIKNMTGGDSETARDLHSNVMREIAFQILLNIVSNFPPHLTVKDLALRERVLVCPWNEFRPPEMRNVNFRDMLIEKHAPAIFSWMVKGFEMFRDMNVGFDLGRAAPQEILRASEDYWKSIGPFTEFFEASLAFNLENRNFCEPFANIKSTYHNWHRIYGHGRVPESDIALAEALVQRGCVRRKGSPAAYYGVIVVNETQVFSGLT